MKPKDHATCLETRLKLWKEGGLNEMVLEGRTIQNRLSKFNTFTAKQSLSQSLTNLMFVGKTKAGLDLLFKVQRGDVLHLNNLSDPNNPESPTVWDVLCSKHP